MLVRADDFPLEWLSVPPRLSTAAVALALALSVPCLAHEAPAHDHAELVPSPAYDPPCGEASAVASLRAAEAFLASFDEATRAEILFDLDAPECAGWPNLPASHVPRAGISVGELSERQAER